MTKKGGPATLVGVRYELKVVVAQIPALLQGTIQFIRYQPFTSAFAPSDPASPVFVDDFSLASTDGKHIYGQAKHNSKDPSWTINRLFTEGVLQQFWNQHNVNAQHILRFTSNLVAPDLVALTNLASNSVSFADFEASLSANQRDQTTDISARLRISPQQLLDLLRKIECVQAIEDQIQDQVIQYATDRFKEPYVFFLAVKDLVEHSPGKLLTKELVSAHLEDKGIHRHPAHLSRNVNQVFKELSAPLLAYKSTIQGIHIERPEVNTLATWIQKPENTQKLAFLLDDAGKGKSVIMRDLLRWLQNNNIPALAIKADYLVNASESLLPVDPDLEDATPESLLSLASATGKAVLLIDQLDALSLTFARNQEQLDRAILLISRACAISDVYVVVSCRSFDRRFDAKLRQLEATAEFTIAPLTPVQIRQVTDAIGVKWEEVATSQVELLSSPLHLNLWAEVALERRSRNERPTGLSSIQDLYETIWELKILKPTKPGITSTNLILAIRRLVEHINTTKELFQPASLLDDLSSSRTYLESESILTRQAGLVGFLHQSFFDFCFARDFTTERNDLFAWITRGPQDLFLRPQTIQVLSHLRGTRSRDYLRSLKRVLDRSARATWVRALRLRDGAVFKSICAVLELLGPTIVRYHLRRLALEWFAQQGNYTTDESQLVLQLLNSASDRSIFVVASRNNPAVLDTAAEMLTTLANKDEDVANELSMYLASIQETHAAKVYTLLKQFLGSSHTWNSRIIHCLNFSRGSFTPQTQECLYWICEHAQAPWDQLGIALSGMAEKDPLTCTRAAGILFRRMLLDWRKQLSPSDHDALSPTSQASIARDTDWKTALQQHRDRTTLLERLLPRQSLWIPELAKHIPTKAPVELLEALVPWFLDALSETTPRTEGRLLRDDLFIRGYESEFDSTATAVVTALKESLIAIAGLDNDQFTVWAERLTQTPYRVAHLMVVDALLAFPGQYAKWSFQYLLADTSRFALGFRNSGTYHSRRLIGRIFPFLKGEQQRRLEEVILGYYPPWEVTPEGLKYRGSDQLELLSEIDPALLSDKTRAALDELKRKFPNYVPPPPIQPTAGFVGSPIPEQTVKLFKDADWIDAILAFPDRSHPRKPQSFLKGGAHELSRVLGSEASKDPQRFARMALQFTNTIAPDYFWGILEGLTKSPIPSCEIYRICEHFLAAMPGNRVAQEIVCFAVQSRAADGPPPSLVKRIQDIALTATDPDTLDVRTDRSLLETGINTTRGQGVRAYVACFATSATVPVDDFISFLNRVAEDRSPAVRSCMISGLTALLRTHSTAAIDLFERALLGAPELLSEQESYELLYYGWGIAPERILKHIQTLVSSSDNDAAENGARLLTIASLNDEALIPLVIDCLAGALPLRKGAVNIFAANVGIPEATEQCVSGLSRLLSDPDDSVRREIAGTFHNLPSPILHSVTTFIMNTLRSLALRECASRLTQYAQKIHNNYPTIALAIADRISQEMLTAMRNKRLASFWDDELVSVVVSVITRNSDTKVRNAGLDIFEKLLASESVNAQKVLMALDR